MQSTHPASVFDTDIIKIKQGSIIRILHIRSRNPSYFRQTCQLLK